MGKNREGKVEYSVFSNPNNAAGKTLHARIANPNVVYTEHITKAISEITSFSSADVKGMLEAFKLVMKLHLDRGDSVELEELGTFGVALKSDYAATEAELIPKKVHFKRITFKAARTLTKDLTYMEFARCTDGSRLKQYTLERRRENMMNFLQKHDMITMTTYREINKCSRHIAEKDVKKEVENGLLIRCGYGPTTFYKLKVKG